MSVKLSDVGLTKPLTFDPEGNFLTLKDVKAKKPTLSITALDDAQKLSLVLKRYELEPDYEVEIIQGGRISKDQLMSEIKAKTDLGKNAVRAEISYLYDLMEEIAAPAPTPSKEREAVAPWPPKEYRKWVPRKWWPIFFRRRIVMAEDTSTGITKHAADSRAKTVFPCFRKRGYTVTVLDGTRCVRANFAEQCKKRGMVYITGVGHGSPTAYTGYRFDRLWEACTYDPLEAKHKIVHLLSCKTAQKLGPDLVKKGASAYFGYYENFTITWTHPEVFWKCDSAIDLGFCAGLTASQVATRTKAVYDYWIGRMRAVHEPTATWLTWDRDALRSPENGEEYGDPTASLRRRVPFFEELEEELETIELVEEEEINIEALFRELTG